MKEKKLTTFTKKLDKSKLIMVSEDIYKRCYAFPPETRRIIQVIRLKDTYIVEYLDDH